MEHQNTLIWEVSFWEFLLVTVVLAGGAAWLTGRSIANSWQGVGHIITYMVLLTGATRFIHFALFSGTLLSVHYYIVDLIVLLLAAGSGFMITRRQQMQRQYGFPASERCGLEQFQQKWEPVLRPELRKTKN